MCEGPFGGGLVDLDQKLEPGLIMVSAGGEIVMIDLRGYSGEEMEEIGNLWGENGCALQQGMTYKGIPFEFESRPKPFCPVRSASGG